MTFRFGALLTLLSAAGVGGRLVGPKPTATAAPATKTAEAGVRGEIAATVPVKMAKASLLAAAQKRAPAEPAAAPTTKSGWGKIAAAVPVKPKASLVVAAQKRAPNQPTGAPATPSGWGKIAAAVSVKPKASLTAEKAFAQPALSEEEDLARLTRGLGAIEKLKSTLTGTGAQGSMEQVASGAMATELGSQGSAIWSTLQSLLNASASVSRQLKGKSGAEREKLMGSLDGVFNRSAEVMSAVAAKAGKEDEKNGNEYLLGLLNRHKQWTMAQQLNATKSFGAALPLAKELLAHHNASEPLAPQLAKLLDADVKPAALVKKATAAALLQLRTYFTMRHR